VEDPASSSGTAPGQPHRYRYRFGTVEFDQARYSLMVDGKPIQVERRPLELLAALIRRPGETVTHEELLQNLWDSRTGIDVIPVAINRLRRALGARQGRSIVNVRGVGYRFDGVVERQVVGKVGGFEGPELKAGQPVPGAEACQLVRALDGREHVWLAVEPATGLRHVFKFAADADGLDALKREYTISRVLLATLGERIEFVPIRQVQFSEPPFHIQREYAGEDFSVWSKRPGRWDEVSREQRLAKFIPLARALADAHGVGVLHKDIKPGNVLVDNDPEGGWRLRLIDFGSGKLLESDRLSGLGVTLQGLGLESLHDPSGEPGTLAYMAPELLQGQPATVQSDLYALGVLLLQWLCGDFERTLASGWQRQVHDDLLCSDLAAATESRPQDRLASVAEWVSRLEALDRRRQQQREAWTQRADAEAAQRALALSRARMPWVRASVGLLTTGLLASLALYTRSERNLKAAQAQERRALALNDFLTTDVLRAADVNTLPGGQPLSLIAVLDAASTHAARAFDHHPDDEARVRFEIAQSYVSNGRSAMAEAEFRRALALMPDSLADTAASEARRRLGAWYEFAYLLSQNGKLDEARQWIERADRLASDEFLPRGSREALSSATAHVTLAYMRQDFRAAAKRVKGMVDLADAVDPEDPAVRVRARQVASEVHYRLNEFGPALSFVRDALAIARRGPHVGEALIARLRLQSARVRIAVGSLSGDDAARELTQIRAELVRTIGDGGPYLAITDEELGNVFSNSGRFEEARKALQSAQSGMKNAFGENHQSTRVTGLNLAIVEIEGGASVQSGILRIEQHRAAFAAEMGGEHSPVVQAMDFFRAMGERKLGHARRALELLAPLDAPSLAQAQPGDYWADWLAAEKALAHAQQSMGQRAQATEMLTVAADGMRQRGAPAWAQAEARRILAGRAPADVKHRHRSPSDG
jgi:DNA-binding winged helix-turn-helix (wHTH) protein/tetratricopeptide (TPR) repeat protein